MIVRFIIHHLFLIDLLCLLVVPLLILFFGWYLTRRRHKKSCLVVGVILALAVAATYYYGKFVETQQLEVRHVELTFADLPEEFDGYQLVQVSDLHLGSLPEGMLERVVDSINAQHADLVVFTGDMQNKEASEIVACQDILRKIKAPY